MNKISSAGNSELKNLFSKQLKNVMQAKDINQSSLAKILGVSESTVGKWILKKSIPRMGIIQKLADYFNVGKLYFLEPAEDNAPSPLNKRDERDIAKQLEKMMANLDSETGLSFYGKPLDEDNKEILRTSLENTLRLSKQLAKKKFTPKKYCK